MLVFPLPGLLESYKNLMVGAELAFPILEELQATHLSKFNMTWELLNEHIYQSCVYADPLVQNNVPIFIGKVSNRVAKNVCFFLSGFFWLKGCALYNFILNSKFKDHSKIITLIIIYFTAKQHFRVNGVQQGAGQGVSIPRR